MGTLPAGDMGPLKVFPGSSFIKRSCIAANTAKIFQAVAVPKKIGAQASRRSVKKPNSMDFWKKNKIDPSKEVLTFQTSIAIGGHKTNKRRGPNVV